MLKVEDALQIETKFSHEHLRSFEDADLIFMEGDDSREMYVVVQGEVVVTKNSRAGDVTLATLRKGDFVGEMSLLESLPRSATARAKGKTKLLAIQPGGFLLKIRRDPTFAFEMLQALSKRIRVTNENLMRELGRAGSTAESLKAVIDGAEFQAGPTQLAPAGNVLEVVRDAVTDVVRDTVTDLMRDKVTDLMRDKVTDIVREVTKK